MIFETFKTFVGNVVNLEKEHNKKLGIDFGDSFLSSKYCCAPTHKYKLGILKRSFSISLSLSLFYDLINVLPCFPPLQNHYSPSHK
jgi:hypothetical protein